MTETAAAADTRAPKSKVIYGHTVEMVLFRQIVALNPFGAKPLQIGATWDAVAAHMVDELKDGLPYLGGGVKQHASKVLALYTSTRGNSDCMKAGRTAKEADELLPLVRDAFDLQNDALESKATVKAEGLRTAEGKSSQGAAARLVLVPLIPPASAASSSTF